MALKAGSLRVQALARESGCRGRRGQRIAPHPREICDNEEKNQGFDTRSPGISEIGAATVTLFFSPLDNCPVAAAWITNCELASSHMRAPVWQSVCRAGGQNSCTQRSGAAQGLSIRDAAVAVAASPFAGLSLCVVIMLSKLVSSPQAGNALPTWGASVFKAHVSYFQLFISTAEQRQRRGIPYGAFRQSPPYLAALLLRSPLLLVSERQSPLLAAATITAVK